MEKEKKKQEYNQNKSVFCIQSLSISCILKGPTKIFEIGRVQDVEKWV